MSHVTTLATSVTEAPGLLHEIFSALDPVLGFFSDYPLAIFIVTLSLALIIAKLATTVLTFFISQFTSRTRIQWDDKVKDLLQRPLFWSIMLPGFLVGLIPLKLSASVSGIFDSLVATVLIVLWSRFILGLINVAINAMSANAHSMSVIKPQTRPLFQNIAFIVVLIFTVYLIFNSWNIDMTAWLASAGIAGIALGFAAKDTLANLFSGVFILADAPYKIGDYVVLDSGERGKVTHIGIRSTRILTRDDVEITIPNAVMGNTRISNESGGPHEKFRLRVKVGVAYGSDIDQVKAILMDVAKNEESVCKDPEPRVRFRAFGNSSLDVELLCWVENPELRGRVLDILNTVIYKRFNAEGIEIPYSKHDVFIKEMPPMKPAE